MPKASYPNQRVIKIHREHCTKGFLQIQIDNWQDACRRLRPQAFALYLYLASNADNYQLELSQVDVTNKIGMPKSTYYDQVKVLENNGYLVPNEKNGYDFYEIPKERVKACTDYGLSNVEAIPYFEQPNPQGVRYFPLYERKSPSENGEIDNKAYPTHNLIDNRDSFGCVGELDRGKKATIKYGEFVF